ncbi:hypothetical protein [Dactylosporangium sp. NPDC050588]|uniref:hypothetical protein n=1 Tax=Dactylosporangium sp. NPDC050588 TaxID=3157211 RepID=UPI0033F99BF1
MTHTLPPAAEYLTAFVEQDPHQLGERVGRAVHRRRGGDRAVEVPVGVLCLGLPAHVGHERAEVDRPQLETRRVGPGEGQQVLDEAAHPRALPGDVPHRRGHVLGRRVRVPPQEPRVVADRGQRRAQLV